MSHGPQIRMLKAVCHAVDEILDGHEYGEFLEAGAKLGRDIACRAAEKLAEADKALEAKLKPDDTGAQ